MDDETTTGGVDNGTDGDDQQKVTIGGEEMTVEQAQELVESGKTLKQFKEQYPEIDINEMPKAFTQARQKLAELEKLNKKPVGELSDAQQKRKQEIQDFFSDPDVKEEFDKLQTEKEKQLREDLSFQETIKSLEAEFDGSDGRPKFDKMKVLKYGQDNNIFNPRSAYKEMHEDALDEWKVSQKLAKRRPTTTFERRGGGGAKAPANAKPAPTSFKEATAAALADNDEE